MGPRPKSYIAGRVGVAVGRFPHGAPQADVPPKRTPKQESLEAPWVSLDELDDLPLRIPEVRNFLQYVSARGPVHPRDLLARAGEPFVGRTVG